MPRKTLLERIFDEQAGRTFGGSVSAWGDRTADEFAREVFADDEFRKNIRELGSRRERSLEAPATRSGRGVLRRAEPASRTVLRQPGVLSG
jgi:hypothetical protein